jgi:hypothetical protein
MLDPEPDPGVKIALSFSEKINLTINNFFFDIIDFLYNNNNKWAFSS